MFTMVDGALHSLPDISQGRAFLGQHETAWMVNQFGKTARKQVFFFFFCFFFVFFSHFISSNFLFFFFFCFVFFSFLGSP